MAEELNPDAFAIRVSQRLFNVLAGRVVEPGPIEPRNQREAVLVEEVRKEARKDRMALLQAVKDEHAQQARTREDTAHLTLEQAANQLDDQFAQLNVPLVDDSAQVKPCHKFRASLLDCYSRNQSNPALQCADQIHAFTECAKQLCTIN